MANSYYNIPPLAALAVFESCARHLSFKAAAKELGVTPGAVSHQVKALEAALGFPLFDRVHRGVVLTEPGRALFETLRGALQAVSGTVDRLSAAQRRRPVVIGATSAVSALWLTPRLRAFCRANPEAAIDQVVSDFPVRSGLRPDLSIVYGAPAAQEGVCTPLFTDEIVAVGSPALLDGRGALGLDDIAAMPLVHFEPAEQDWTTWPAWFAALGGTAPEQRNLAVNQYAIALQMAEDGAGLMLGWRRLIAPLLEAGRLLVASRDSLPAPHPFVLCRSDPQNADPRVEALEAWLRVAL